MFDTLGSFSVVYFILASILIALVIFEKPLLELEDKFDAYIARRKKARKEATR